MAKELPYFKFEPSEWENGNIQMLSYEDKGLFIELCAIYWSRLGDLPLKLAIQKLCGGNATALDSLCEEKIIAIQDECIIINFLNEQLLEFEDLRKQNKVNALKGWEKRKKQNVSDRNATASIPQSDRNAIREEKIREDKSILKKDILERKNEFSLQSNQFKNNYSEKIIKEFIDYWTESNLQGKKMKYEMQKTFDINLRLKKWYENSLKFGQNSKPQNKTNTYTSNNFKYEDKL